VKRLTVAICTRNRAASLRSALASLAECAKPKSMWEVVVVDNGSTDDTRAVVSGAEHDIPVRLVVEAVPGLSNARNAAVRASRGDYILWTDDDCVVSHDWLVAYNQAFERWPSAAVFGGPIVPRFAGHPPDWLVRIAPRVRTAFAARDFGSEFVTLDETRVPFGANYAIRAVEQRGRLYDVRRGRGADVPIGEETELIRGLFGAGSQGRWVPDAIVTHTIPPERQTVDYLRTYFEADGAAEERQLAGSEMSDVALRFRALRSELRYQVERRVAGPEVWIEALITASVARGRLRARQPSRSPTDVPR
jgi:glycosyltransferase involved in cell wall biosynthesis